jgi:hypothetical protein
MNPDGKKGSFVWKRWWGRWVTEKRRIISPEPVR